MNVTTVTVKAADVESTLTELLGQGFQIVGMLPASKRDGYVRVFVVAGTETR